MEVSIGSSLGAAAASGLAGMAGMAGVGVRGAGGLPRDGLDAVRPTVAASPTLVVTGLAGEDQESEGGGPKQGSGANDGGRQSRHRRILHTGSRTPGPELPVSCGQSMP
jgi:hypothetical protein